MALTLKYMNHEARCLLPKWWCLASRQRGSGWRQSRATIPFSSMSWFSLLQIDVEEPETWENPTKLFVIHNIVWRRTQLLAVIISIM